MNDLSQEYKPSVLRLDGVWGTEWELAGLMKTHEAKLGYLTLSYQKRMADHFEFGLKPEYRERFLYKEYDFLQYMYLYTAIVC